MTKEEILEKIARKPTVFLVGGFRPDDDILSSWVGKVMVGKEGEEWPMSDGEPMIPLCQINLTRIPYKPDNLKDIEFITVFIDGEDLPCKDEPNGEKWCLRAYKKIDELIPIKSPQMDCYMRLKPFQLKPELVEADCPSWEDCPVEISEECDDDYHDIFINRDGLKVGGWPSLIQGEIFWAPLNRQPAKPEYVFQIDSLEKAGLFWGDTGCAYFGRGTTPGHEDTWHFTWQCF